MTERIFEKEDFIICECNYDGDFKDPFISNFIKQNYNFNEEDITKLID